MYYRYNYTSDGILYSQLPPQFSFTTETGSLDITSPSVKLNISITDADNNNNGEIDTDFQYRTRRNGTLWSLWTTPSPQINFTLGDIDAGDFDISIELKNMYGFSQGVLSLTYDPPETAAIPSYSTVLILSVLFFSVTIIILQSVKRLKT